MSVYNRQHDKTDLPYKVHIGSLPILLNFPHSGRLYPAQYLKFIAHTKHSLRSLEDPYLDFLLPDLAQNDTYLLAHRYGRALIDVNRSLINEHEKPVVNGEAMPLIPTSLPSGCSLYRQKLHNLEVRKRIQYLYKPYHQQFENIIQLMKKNFNKVLLIDCHSMPSYGGSKDPDAYKIRPDIIIADNFGDAADAFIVSSIEEAFTVNGLSVFRNYPYAGGHIINHYGRKNHNVHAIQIEINRNLYMCEKTFQLKPESLHLRHKIHCIIRQIQKLLF